MCDLDSYRWAVQNGDLSSVKSFTETENFNVDVPMKYGKTALSAAADYGQYEIISYLIEIGANVNLIDEIGMTPLLTAIYEGHTKCVQLLLEKGADKTKKSPEGTTYYECAEKDDIKKLLE